MVHPSSLDSAEQEELKLLRKLYKVELKYTKDITPDVDLIDDVMEELKDFYQRLKKKN